MIKVLLFGAAGRMGRLVIEELSDLQDIALAAGVEHPDHSAVGKSIGNTNILADGSHLPDCNVWVDLSHADPALNHVKRASESGTPIVVAATGFSTVEEKKIEQMADHCPIMMAPNLSAGIGVVDRLIGDAAELLGDDFDPALFEIHHAGKRDAPSGTALRLARRVELKGKTPQIASLRAGSAIGEHQVRFVGRYEEVVIIHRAWSRRAFSRGLPQAIRFIIGKKPGLYTIRHLYNS